MSWWRMIMSPLGHMTSGPPWAAWCFLYQVSYHLCRCQGCSRPPFIATFKAFTFAVVITVSHVIWQCKTFSLSVQWLVVCFMCSCWLDLATMIVWVHHYRCTGTVWEPCIVCTTVQSQSCLVTWKVFWASTYSRTSLNKFAIYWSLFFLMQ